MKLVSLKAHGESGDCSHIIIAEYSTSQEKQYSGRNLAWKPLGPSEIHKISKCMDRLTVSI